MLVSRYCDLLTSPSASHSGARFLLYKIHFDLYLRAICVLLSFVNVCTVSFESFIKTHRSLTLLFSSVAIFVWCLIVCLFICSFVQLFYQKGKEATTLNGKKILFSQCETLHKCQWTYVKFNVG